MKHRDHEKWAQGIHERQRNIVFPDTARNFGGFWGALPADPYSLSSCRIYRTDRFLYSFCRLRRIHDVAARQGVDGKQNRQWVLAEFSSLYTIAHLLPYPALKSSSTKSTDDPS